MLTVIMLAVSDAVRQGGLWALLALLALQFQVTPLQVGRAVELAGQLCRLGLGRSGRFLTLGLLAVGDALLI